jgi:hypothetical protein
MEDEPCAICSGPSEDPHHVTGKGPDEEYLDPDLTAPVCHDDHEMIHEDLRNEKLNKPLGRASIPERIAYRLDRLGVLLSRVAEQLPFDWVVRVATAVRSWAEELRCFVQGLDLWNPDWRLGGIG